MYEGRPDGWGPDGVGDAALICGTALSGLVGKWIVTHDPVVKTEAAKVATGVLNLAVLHGYRGFAGRGMLVSAEAPTGSDAYATNATDTDNVRLMPLAASLRADVLRVAVPPHAAAGFRFE